MTSNSTFRLVLIIQMSLLMTFTNYSSAILAQDSIQPLKTIYAYKQKQQPIGFDNYQMATYYYNGNKTYNLRGYIASDTPGTVSAIEVNPSGTSFALLTKKNNISKVSIHDLWEAKREIGKLRKVDNALAITYSPDAKSLVVATPTEILICNARTLEITNRIPTNIISRKIAVSSNNYYLAATDGSHLVIWNMDTKNIRKEFEFDTMVNDIVFSDDSKLMAILTADGKLSIYDTQNFLITNSNDALDNAISCTFNSDGKYMAVVCKGTRIALINLMDNSERSYIEDETGGINNVRFVQDSNEDTYLVYNTNNSITYKRMSELTPNFTRLLTEELDKMMIDWMKQMPEESLDDYKLRVNEETRLEQMKLFEQEIATRLADNLVSMSEITLGYYNTESNMLSVNFDNMPSIYLEVPSEDIIEFSNVEELEFTNMRYGLTNDDKFELIYVDIRNKSTGKTYVYNNLERRSLDYLKLDEDFIPLEVIKQSNMQEMKLQEIKETVVSMAKEQNTISDHTNIAVKTNVESSTNAEGKRIMNYITDFSYTVEKEYSAQEDFAPGKYKAEESGAAMSMMEIIKQAFEGEFASYIKSGKKLQIKITGMADAMPINNTITYDGCYGEYVGEPVYKNNALGNITLTKKVSISQNEQLAFARALGVKDYLTKNIPGITQMDTDYKYNVMVTSGKGGEYRRINVNITFIDAF